MIQTRTRNVAKKYSITKIKSGEFIVSQNFEEPNYLKIENDKVNRVNVIGTLVNKDDINGRDVLTIDDGSKINLMTFGDLDFSTFNVGDVVIIIGRPRNNGNEIFIAVESIKKIEPKWILVRKKELEFFQKYYQNSAPKITDDIKVDYDSFGKPKNEENLIEDEESIISEDTQDTSSDEKNDPKIIYTKILNIIEELDKGEGSNFIDVLTKLKDLGHDLEKGELMINKMIIDGEIFEIQGNLKISK